MKDISLELTMGGRTVSSEEAIRFFGSVLELLDDPIKTEDFRNQYEYALNRLRYLARLDIPATPKEDKGRFTTCNCGRCGFCLDRGIDKFCPHCGQRVRW